MKLSYDRTSIVNRGYLGKRGYKPIGIVIHNDAGSGSAMTYKNQLVNASYDRLANGIAHSYISGTQVWQALPESYIAWHTANQNGNQNYYGIEVCQSMSASDKDFMANEQSAFKETARLLKKWGLKPNRDTIKLHDMFSSTQCPHRSLALHAGWTSSQMASDSAKTKTQDYFIEQVKKYYDGGSGSSTTSKATKTEVPKGWDGVNQYGTIYKAEKGKFTCGKTEIFARLGSPKLTEPNGYWFQPKGYTNYDEVALSDNLVWIGYDWKGKRYYLPIREWNGKTGSDYKVGKLWGVIS